MTQNKQAAPTDVEKAKRQAWAEYSKKTGRYDTWENPNVEFSLAFEAGWNARAALTWRRIASVADLPKDDGFYLWSCHFGDQSDVRKIQLLTMQDGSRRVGPGIDLPIGREITAWMPLPSPFEQEKP